MSTDDRGINITTAIRRDDFEDMIHIAIIDELVWLEKRGEVKNAYELSREIRMKLGDKFFR